MNRKAFYPVSWVPTVYFAMGLPFVVLNMVSVLMFKGLDISDAQIALWTSLIMLPWTLKFLWSPPTRFLGDFRHFQGFSRLFVPFGLLRPLCASYRLQHALVLIHQFYRKLRVYPWRCIFSFPGAVLSLLNVGSCRFRV